MQLLNLQQCMLIKPSSLHGLLRIRPQARCHAIRCLATTTNTHQHELVTWVHKHGGTVSPSINVVAWGGDDGGSGFGLGATDPVTSGTQLIMLPTALHLTFTEDDPPPAAAAESSPTARALRALVRQVPQELWGGKLALHLLAQRARGNGSKWAPYIRNLPVGFVGVPMFFAGDELSALHYPPVVEQVKKRCRWLLSFAGGALQEEGAVQDAFFGARIDANALVTSRAFRVRGPQHPASCLPLVDMANHSFSPNASIRPIGSTGIAMVAVRDIEAGEPLLLDYGKLSNDFFLMDYGFIMENNPYDDIKLSFDLSLLDSGRALAGMDGELQPAPWRQALLAELNLTGPGARLEVTLGRGGSLVDPRLLAAARILCAASPADVRNRTTASLGHWDAPLSPYNEVQALTTLVGVAALSLSAFPTRLEEDVQLLTGQASPEKEGEGNTDASPTDAPPANLTGNMRLAIMFRVEKKRLLVEAMQAMGERIKELAKGPHMATAPPGKPATPGSHRGGSGKRAGKAKQPGTPPKRATSKGFGA